MEPIIDHVQITVRDMAVAVPFYDKLMPLLGFEEYLVEYLHPRLGFAISSPRSAFASKPVHRRRPGAVHHIAFKAPSRAAVDGLHTELERMGAMIVSAPREYPEYGRHQVRDRVHHARRNLDWRPSPGWISGPTTCSASTADSSSGPAIPGRSAATALGGARPRR